MKIIKIDFRAHSLSAEINCIDCWADFFSFSHHSNIKDCKLEWRVVDNIRPKSLNYVMENPNQ
ncbi:MAG: hypothetical protein FWE42_06295 [Defluviitaleaceae bacterium]|nr:hypothetical protein [Defluviitaleaceae bacterium]